MDMVIKAALHMMRSLCKYLITKCFAMDANVSTNYFQEKALKGFVQIRQPTIKIVSAHLTQISFLLNSKLHKNSFLLDKAVLLKSDLNLIACISVKVFCFSKLMFM